MSKVRAIVVDIIGEEGLHVVSFKHFEHTIAMMSLELPSIKIGSEVTLNIKPSSVGIAKNCSGDFSFSNRLKVKIAELNIGDILCALKLEISPNVYIESLITASSAKRIKLKKGESVEAFFKASEVSVREVIK